nr:MFS transporter [Paenibacillus donghaensis]
MRLFKHHVPEEQLQQGMALFQSLMAIFMVLGPMLGTFIYSTFGLETSIAVMGVVFLLSALVLIRLPEDNMEPQTVAVKGQFRKDFIEGFRYVWQSQVLRMLGLAFILAGLAVGVAQALNLFIVTERLGRSEEFLQYLLMVNGAAMLIGGGIVAVFAKRVPPQLLLAIGMLAGAVCTAIVGYSTSVPVTLTGSISEWSCFPLHSYRDQHNDSEMVTCFHCRPGEWGAESDVRWHDGRFHVFRWRVKGCIFAGYDL